MTTLAPDVRAMPLPGEAAGGPMSFPLERSRHSIGGSHTVVTYPPLALLEPEAPEAVLCDAKAERGINLYAHIAFCEFQCPFCHYETKFRKLRTEKDAALDAYMAALEREWRGWQERLPDGSLASLYIGGGTPTSIPLASLVQLIRKLLDYPKETNFGFCVEASPASVAGEEGADALHILKALGANRISMGAQTANGQLLKRTRGHSRETLSQAAENLAGLGLPYNVDFIQDLPDQDDAALGEDLSFISEHLPPQITWYVLRLEPKSAWRPRLDAGLIELPSSGVSIARRLRILEEMRGLGYAPGPGGRFSRVSQAPDPYKRIRSQLGDTLLGLGASAYSHGWGWFFRNVYSANGVNGVKEYAERVLRGASAIVEARRITATDREVSRVLAAVRSCVPAIEALELSAPYRAQVEPRFKALMTHGLLERQAAGLCLTDRGRALEEEICVSFYPDDVRERACHASKILEIN